MADIKISALSAMSADVDKDDVLPIINGGTTKKIKVSELLAGTVQPINDPAEPEGEDDTTTAHLIYGINVVRNATNADFCFRLPQTPQKGKIVSIVNASSLTIRIFPSVTGGSINGIVDGFVDVPPNKQIYQITCWENPNPGDWSSNRVMSALLQFSEVSINHTNGVADIFAGVNSVLSSSVGVGSDGTNMILTPNSSYWRSESFPARATRMKVYTNIVADDCSDDTLPNAIVVWRQQAYKDGANSGTSGQRETVFYKKTGVNAGAPFYPETTAGIVAGGVVNTPRLIGDVGTFFSETLAPNDIGAEIGAGGQYSNYYYTFGFQIPASAATKVYRFRIEIEYI